jgi:predicted Rossmann fold nucleotide-binding protein DprA/Smf involved in DNA uptake
MYNLAIIGSRKFPDLDSAYSKIFNEFSKIKESSPDICVLTGGAIGVDGLAVRFARENELKYEVIRPVNEADKLSYLFRNVEILAKADEVWA